MLRRLFSLVLLVALLHLHQHAQASTVVSTSQGLQCSHAVELSPEKFAFVQGGKKLYIADQFANRVMVFLIQSRNFAASIKTTGMINGLISSQDGRNAYLITNQDHISTISTIDTSQDVITQSKKVGDGEANFAVLKPNSSLAFVSWNEPVISIVDLGAAPQYSRIIHGVFGSGQFAVYNDRIYTQTMQGFGITNLKTEKSDYYAPYDEGATTNLVLNGDGSELAVFYTSKNGGGIVFVRTSDVTISGKMELRDSPMWANYSSDNGKLFIGGWSPHKVSSPDTNPPSSPAMMSKSIPVLLVVNPKTQELAKRVELPGEALSNGIISPDNRFLYFFGLSHHIPMINVLEVHSYSIIHQIPVPCDGK